VHKKKKREIFDKNFRVCRFLEQISRKNFREFKTFAEGQNPSQNI